tara:strand:- start:54 stop:365 length:312 start_codon:yes stop_codon:yes gene_type:complete
LISVVAGLALSQHSVATTRLSARAETVIIIVIIAVVAGLACLNDGVSTAGQLTVIGARVVVDVIGVITGLDIHLQDAISTPRLLAGSEALVTIVLIPVVTLFV